MTQCKSSNTPVSTLLHFHSLFSKAMTTGKFFFIAFCFAINLWHSAVASSFKWSSCTRNSYVAVGNVTINPDPITPGQTLTSVITGEVLQDMQGGKIQVSFPLYNRNLNYCAPQEGRPCPVRKGHLEVPFSTPIPSMASFFAGQTINGQIKVTDSTGKLVVCLKLTLPVASRRSEGTKWFQDLEVLESLLGDSNFNLGKPDELFSLADWAIENKNAEDFAPTFFQKVLELMEPVPSALLQLFQFNN